MKKQITRISILQSSKIPTLIYAIFGFVYMIPGVFMLFSSNIALRVQGMIFCSMPIILAIFGFIFFVVFAALYNLLAKFVGGVEFEVCDIEK